MALTHSISPIVTNGLVLNLDAANPRSYPRTGTNWFDVSGNGSHGTLTNGPTYNSANGGVINFDGTDDLVTANISITYPMTLSCWVQTSNAQSSYVILLNSDSSNWLSLGFVFVSGAGWYLDGRIVNAGIPFQFQQGYLGPSGGFPTRWLNLAVVYTSSVLRSAYVDGVFVGSSTVSVTCPLITNARIGGGDFGARKLRGLLSTAYIYNRALSASEIAQNYNALRGRFGV